MELHFKHAYPESVCGTVVGPRPQPTIALRN